MTDLICVGLENLQVGDVIPALNATVVGVRKVKSGRVGKSRVEFIDLTMNRVLLVKKRVVIQRTPEGRVVIPWDSKEISWNVSVMRVDPNKT